MSNTGLDSATNGRNSANNRTAHYRNNQQQDIISKTGIGGNCGGSGSSNLYTAMVSQRSAIPSKLINTKHTDNGQKLKTTTALPPTDNNIGNNNSQKNLCSTANKTAAAAAAAAANNLPKTASTTGHRRDHSNFNGQTAKQQLKQQQQQLLAQRDPSKYHYIKPQTVLRPQNYEGDDQIAKQYIENIANNSNDPFTLVYYDDVLISGSLEALIEHMVPTQDYHPNKTYIFSFLLSARLFIPPHELLAKISQTWEKQQQQQPQLRMQSQFCTASSSTTSSIGGGIGGISGGRDQVDDAGNKFNPHMVQHPTISPLHKAVIEQQQQQQYRSTQKSAQNCIRLLSEWIETFPYDFRDERLMQQVRILTRKCVYIDNSLGKQVSGILQSLVQRLTALEKYEEFLQALFQTDLNTTTSSPAYYNTSAAAAYSCSVPAQNSLTKSTVAALNSHHDNYHHHHHHHHQPKYSNATHMMATSNAISSSTPTTCINSSSCSSSSASGISSSDISNSHDIFGIMDICSSCAQLAHQLTAIELERLSHIGPEEFVQAFAKEYKSTIAEQGGKPTMIIGNESTQLYKCPSASSALCNMKKTRNLESYVEWFNRLSYLTATEIVKFPKKKQRVRIIEYWIETARECFNIGNFNSLMAIIAGLNLSPISRLKKTWSKVQSAKFAVLEHQMDPTSNFNSYRSTLKAAMWRSEGATEERERIIIPFFSLFVKDLYFLNEGCSNRLSNHHINFEKCSQLAKQIMEFNEWKQVKCPFEKLPNVIAYLQTTSVSNENTLSMASFECEPPENTEEKDRYKTVKAESKQQLLQQLQQEQQQQQ